MTMRNFKDSNRIRRTLLAELRLTLLNGSHHHVAGARSRKAVEARAGLVHSNDVQVLGTAVVGAVDNRTDGETDGHPELGARRAGRYNKACQTQFTHG